MGKCKIVKSLEARNRDEARKRMPTVLADAQQGMAMVTLTSFAASRDVSPAASSAGGNSADEANSAGVRNPRDV
jgi:hypothetical protein